MSRTTASPHRAACLAASVCHEINNPITSIVTFNNLILSYIQNGDVGTDRAREIERYLSLSVQEAMRCGEIVKNLLTFARQKKVEAKKIELVDMINTIMLLTGHQIEMAGIACEINLPDGSFTVWGDSAQIQQCLINLIFNAIDAMTDGGNLTLTGGIDDHENMIWLTIADNGQGIGHDELPRTGPYRRL